MIETNNDQITLDGEHIRALYQHLRRYEDSLSPRMSELQIAVQRLLYETLSIDEIERLHNETEPH